MALREIYAKRAVEFDFNLLNFPDRIVAEGDGRVIAALIGRPSEQVDLLLDGGYGTPAKRWETIIELMNRGENYLRDMGIRHIHCFVPQTIVKAYGRRLESLGFNREAGATFLKEL